MVAGCTSVGVTTGWHSGGNGAGVSTGRNRESEREENAKVTP